MLLKALVMIEFVLNHYFTIIIILSFTGILFHLLFLVLGFDENWSISAFVGKAGALANVAVVFPLIGSIYDPQVFTKLQGHDAVVILACIYIVYFAVSNIVPKYVAERIRRQANSKFKNNMESLEDDC